MLSALQYDYSHTSDIEREAAMESTPMSRLSCSAADKPKKKKGRKNDGRYLNGRDAPRDGTPKKRTA